MKVELTPTYILNSRPYLESSLLLEAFTREYGRIAMVARGVKRGKTAKFGLLQPFNMLLMSWSGTGPLHTMIYVEAYGRPNFLREEKLICGMYLNELLVKLLPHGDPYVDLFSFYNITIKKLADHDCADCHNDGVCHRFNIVHKKYDNGKPYREQEILRIFEKKLLMAMGYALPLNKDIITGEIIDKDQYYVFDFEKGPKSIDNSDNVVTKKHIFKGSSLLALNNEVFDTKEALVDAKRLMRLALALRLGMQPLHSRELLV